MFIGKEHSISPAIGSTLPPILRDRTRPPANSRRTAHHTRAAFTLVEILVASALSVIMIGTLLAALNSVSNSYSLGSSRIETAGEARTAIDILRRDLTSAYTGRIDEPSLAAIDQYGQARPPQAAHANAFSGISTAIPRLSRRLILPFEINRMSGAIFNPETDNPTAANKSIANALEPLSNDQTYHPNYDALAFVTRAPLSRQSHTAVDRAILLQQRSSSGDDQPRSEGDACIAAYYVAYTKNASIPNAPASMKLFRHFRASGSVRNADSGGGRSQGHAYHVLEAALKYSRIPRLEGRLDNADLPMLLTPVTNYDGRETVHPWPRFAADSGGQIDYRSLPEPPPDYLLENRDWNDLDSQTSLHADEPIAYNVIAFKVVPLSWLSDPTNGTEFLADSEQINKAYQLNGHSSEEWPVAVTPQALRITLTIIDDKVASLLQSRADWEEWQNRPGLEQLINKAARTFETLIQIGNDEI